VLAVAGCTALAGALAFAGYVQVRSARHVVLPTAARRYPVGRRVVTWTEPQADPLDPQHRPRRLSVWVWYPASGEASDGARAPYAPDGWASAMRPSRLERLLGRPVTNVEVAARADAPPAAQRFPLVVFTPGMGNNSLEQSVVASGLAGLGYVVAVPTPTYSADVTVVDDHAVRSTEQGQRLPADHALLAAVWERDERFVADRLLATGADASSPLHGHVDPTRVAYAGHSFGGATSLQTCHDDARCAAAADVDGYLFGEPVTRTGEGRPLLLLASDGSCVTGRCDLSGRSPDDRAGRDDARALLDHGSGPKDVVEVRGAGHANFTDLGVWYYAEPVRLALRASGAFGSVDGATALRVELDCLAAFLDTRLRGAAPDRLEAAVAAHPQAQLVVHRG
jgi:dienelactone hydrolase